MRQQRPRGSTTRDAVVNAALEVVDRVGVEALTIRAVAAAAGAPPMSLYTHFANKEELLDLMYAEISRRMYADTGHDQWQDALLALGRQVREALLTHPHWATLLARRAPPMSTAARERVVTMMKDAGIAGSDALRSFSAAMLVAVGLSLVELTFRVPEGASRFDPRFEALRTWFEQEGIVGAPTSREAPPMDWAAMFELALRRVVSGSQDRPSTPGSLQP